MRTRYIILFILLLPFIYINASNNSHHLKFKGIDMGMDFYDFWNLVVEKCSGKVFSFFSPDIH